MKTKILLLFCSLFYIVNSFGQPELLTYTATFTDSAKKEELYSRAKVWICKVWRNPKQVIQVDDKDGGIIIVRGLVNLSSRWHFLNGSVQCNEGMEPCYFTLNIHVKDGKWKYEITNIGAIDRPFEKDEPAKPGKAMKEWRQTCVPEIIDVCSMIEKAMKIETTF